MNDDNIEEITMTRKVYMLPRELVDRIAAFQRAKKLPSEVEAVRRLLDEALLHRDDADSLLLRFSDRLKVDAMPSSVARDLLVGHPLIQQLGFPDLDSVTFTMKGFGEFKMRSDGKAFKMNPHNDSWESYAYDIPF